MNLDALIFDLEMAHRRLPEVPGDEDEDLGGFEEWRLLRARLPELIEFAKEVRREREAG